jgi:RHS repeat-associated protein
VGTAETVVGIATTGGTTQTLVSPVDPAGNRLGNSTGGTVTWTMPDLHGNAAATISGDESAIVDALRYDAYGQTVASSAGLSPGASAWKFQGRLDVSPTSTPLYDMSARFYTPGIGTFTQIDSALGSVSDLLSLNRFLYAEANPATLVDPSGHYVPMCPDGIPAYCGITRSASLSTSSSAATSSPSGTAGSSSGSSSSQGPVGAQGPSDPSPFERFLGSTVQTVWNGTVGFAWDLGTGTYYRNAMITGATIGGWVHERGPGVLWDNFAAGVNYVTSTPEGWGMVTGTVIVFAVGSKVVSAAAGSGEAEGTTSISNDRPVIFNRPASGSTIAQDGQIRAYVNVCNEAYCAGALSPTGRVSTAGTTRISASNAAAAERAIHPELYPDGVVAGHGPDVTWTGNPVPFKWLPLDQSVNASLGAQAAARYLLGYQPTGFWFSDDYIMEFGALPGQ